MSKQEDRIERLERDRAALLEACNNLVSLAEYGADYMANDGYSEDAADATGDIKAARAAIADAERIEDVA